MRVGRVETRPAVDFEVKREKDAAEADAVLAQLGPTLDLLTLLDLLTPDLPKLKRGQTCRRNIKY